MVWPCTPRSEFIIAILRCCHAANILARRMGFDPRTIIVCNAIGCETVVTMSDAFAYPIVRQNEPSIGFFCTPACFLRAIPPHGCGGANENLYPLSQRSGAGYALSMGMAEVLVF